MTDLPLPELLAPAGSEESLRAALAAGADAVYFGGAAFSNRMRAKNFAGESIRNAIKLCHSVGAAAHITVNTRVRGRETDDVLAFAETILGGKPDERADALIVADLGVARLIKEAFPHAVLHASTQTSLSSVSDCETLERLGFSRLVVPRELSLGEIRALVSRSPIEIEMFIHGAHCVSCSGQCLLSFVMGGRSGNRGECAQPCRLPYTLTAQNRSLGGTYPLSMADMYLGGHMAEIISSGVSSLKIEGRLKSPTYVYGVTKIYRRLLDERRNATEDEKHALEALFTRGFTDGYLTSRYSKMAGVKSSENDKAGSILKEISHALAMRARSAAEQAKTNGQPIRAKFTLHANEAARLMFICGDVCAEVTGDIPSPSSGNPINAESASKNITKLGGSGFSLSPNDIKFDIDDGLWMPLSAINDLRRRAVAALSSKLADMSSAPTEPRPTAQKTTRRPMKEKTTAILSAEIADLSLMLRDGEDGFGEMISSVSRLYVPVKDIRRAAELCGSDKRGKICAVLPVLAPDDCETRKTLSEIKKSGVRRVLCHTVGQISLAKEHDLLADISFRANVTNSVAASVYEDLGADSLTLSPELGVSASSGIARTARLPIGLIGYGRLPVMHLSRCIISGGVCRKGNCGGRISPSDVRPHTCTAELRDRLGEVFPVIGMDDCTNIVYNAAVTWMGDRSDELTLGGYGAIIHFMFTTETARDAADVIRAYRHGEKRPGRRIQ